MLLTNKNYNTFMAMSYVNYNCVEDEEFEQDIERIKYLKKLFTTYRKKGELKDRLVMNHLVILFNVFNTEALLKILFFKLEKDLDILIPFLKVLNYCPDKISGIKEVGYEININDIKTDIFIESQIRKSLKNGL